ncbi:hypothetical protein ISCGN_009402 [Ixodes scapularis]
MIRTSRYGFSNAQIEEDRLQVGVLKVVPPVDCEAGGGGDEHSSTSATSVSAVYMACAVPKSSPSCTLASSQVSVSRKIVLSGIRGGHTPARDFFRGLLQYVPEDGFFFLCGDFNCVIDSSRDVRGPGRGRNTSDAQELVRLLGLHDLRDAWVELHGAAYDSTWSRGTSSSRLDRVYVQKHLASRLLSCEVLSFPSAAGYVSDHRPVSAVFDVTGFLYPRGDTWRLDISLLRDEPSISSLRQSIRASLTAVALTPAQWDALKSDCRFFATAAGKSLRRRTTEALNEVVRRIRIVQRGVVRTSLMFEYLTVLRDRHQRLLSMSSRSAVAQRLRDQPVEDPEVLRCLRATRAGGDGYSYVPSVHLADGSLSEDPREIGAVFRNFFSSLFCSNPAVNISNFAERVRLFCGDLPACPDDLGSSLFRPTTREELFDVLRAMKVGSAPGPDGLPAEFYVTFWDVLANPLVQLVNGFLETGEVPPSFRRGRVILLPKEDGSSSDPAAWRPITLLNADYKIVASLLVSRLRTVMPHVLSSENAGHDAFRFNEEQNTLIVSTPALENAVKYGEVHSISLKGQTYEVVACAIPPDDTIKGVIHGIPDEDSEQDVLNNLVTARNPNVLHARRMGRSKSAVVLFKGQKVPFWIMYGNVEYKCNLYKKKIEVCGTCGGVGHRSDVCPRPKEQRCKICNTLNPTDGHACSPSCGICGKAHPTGDTRCKQRFKTPYILQQRQWEKKKKQEESRFKEEDFPPLPKGRSRSRSRSRSRASVRSTSRQRSGSRRRSKSRRRSSSRQRVSWAGVTDHKASEKKSKEAKAQNDKLDEILVMMRQLQEENKALRVMVEKTEKENAWLRTQLQQKSNETEKEPEKASPPAKRKMVVRPGQETVALDKAEAPLQQEVNKQVVELMCNPEWLTQLARHMEQLRTAQVVRNQDGEQ